MLPKFIHSIEPLTYILSVRKCLIITYFINIHSSVVVVPDNNGWHHCHVRNHRDEWGRWGNDDTAGVGSQAVGSKKGSDEGQSQSWIVADEAVQVV